MKINEITTIKARTPAQARIAALKQGVDHAQDALKAERKRQKVQAAQARLQKAVAASA